MAIKELMYVVTENSKDNNRQLKEQFKVRTRYLLNRQLKKQFDFKIRTAYMRNESSKHSSISEQ